MSHGTNFILLGYDPVSERPVIGFKMPYVDRQKLISFLELDSATFDFEAFGCVDINRKNLEKMLTIPLPEPLGRLDWMVEAEAPTRPHKEALSEWLSRQAIVALDLARFLKACEVKGYTLLSQWMDKEPQQLAACDPR